MRTQALLGRAVCVSGIAVGLGFGASGCGPGSSSWMAEPLVAPEDEWRNTPAYLASRAGSSSRPNPRGAKTTTESAKPPTEMEPSDPERTPGPGVGEGQRRFAPDAPKPTSSSALPDGATGGHSLGRFKNTYYDFPNQSSLPAGKAVTLYDAQCRSVAEVSDQFFQRLCVQGSGMLSSGDTVSFAKRDCSCAATCTKTGQQLCFDRLGADKFPWGRGSTGRPIAALRTIAVDPAVVPLGSLVYVPEFDGVPISAEARHDGCFLAQDRGLWVRSRHIDVFAGTPEMRLALERHVPTNRGVTVVLDSPRCQAAAR